MKNGNKILCSRYTDEIKNDSATSSKMFNLSKKLENDNLREIHKALYGLLTAGYDISNMRNVEELEKYVNVKKLTANCWMSLTTTLSYITNYS